MKNIIFLTSLFITMLFPKAQQVPIETDWDNVTAGMYLKDFNNKFDKYVGIWTATVGNKEVKFVVEKKMHFPVKTLSRYYYSDALLMRYEVKVSGQVVESTLGLVDNAVKIYSTGPSYYENEVRFTNMGLLCNVGLGSIYLTYIDATHLEWFFELGENVLNNIDCPDVQAAKNLQVNLPYEPKNIIFTKQ